MNDTSVDKTLEDYGTVRVPSEKTYSGWHIGLVLLGINICIPAFLLGGFLSRHAPFSGVAAAVTAGALLLTLISVMTGLIGRRTGLSAAMSLTDVFGKRGYLFFAFLLVFVSFVWFGIQLEVFGFTLKEAFSIPRLAGTVTGGLLMIATAFFGFKGIEFLSRLAVPLLAVLLGVGFFFGTRGASFQIVLSQTPVEPLPFSTLFATVAGALIVQSVLMPDITRYAGSKKGVLGGMSLGVLVGFPAVLLLSAYLGYAAGESDLIRFFLSLPGNTWHAFALVTLLLATWTTNDNNLYSAALALNAIFPARKKWGLTLAAGAAGIALALFGILQHLIPLMQFLGGLITPVGLVMILHYFIRKLSPAAAFCIWLLGAVPTLLFFFSK